MATKILVTLGLAAAFAAGFAIRGVVPGEPVAYAQANRVFELRTYTVEDGKLDALHTRFREQTLPKFFKKHGMTSIWYGKPMDAPLSQNTMAYLIAFPSRDAAKKSWDAFRADQEWAKAAAASGVGQLKKLESVYFEPTDYSPLK
jgi:hypothetical protein